MVYLIFHGFVKTNVSYNLFVNNKNFPLFLVENFPSLWVKSHLVFIYHWLNEKFAFPR